MATCDGGAAFDRGGEPWGSGRGLLRSRDHDCLALLGGELDALAQGDWEALAWALSTLQDRSGGAVGRVRQPVRDERGSLADVSTIRELICAPEFTWECGAALAVMACESGGDPAAISPDGQNWGLMQVNLVHLWRVGGDPYRLLDPETNMRVAWDIYVDGGGWGPWACKP